MELSRELTRMNAEELRDLSANPLEQLASKDKELKANQLKIDQLTHEMAILKRYRFDRRSEQMDPMQRSLLDESIDADIEAISLELEALKVTPSAVPKDKPRRTALPASIPRREIRHEPEATQCSCGCSLERIGEDVSEKLDYIPGVLEVERHIRGKWVCRSCETLIQAPVAPHIIDKGIPTANLLVQVLIAKYLDHLPLYRQEQIFARAGLALPRSTLAQWVGACGVKLAPLVEAMKAELLSRTVLHADETPVPMLKPGLGKTRRAYLWSYCSSEYEERQIVIYDFAEGRGGIHARQFLGQWAGKLVCDDYAGYKALFEQGVIEIGCMAHARRKLHDLYANHRSEIAEEGLRYFAALYEVEREARERKLDAQDRQLLRQQRSKPIAESLRQWMTPQRGQVPDGSATAKAVDYALGRWAALTRYLEDGDLPIDNNHVENRIRPVALGRSYVQLRIMRGSMLAHDREFGFRSMSEGIIYQVAVHNTRCSSPGISRHEEIRHAPPPFVSRDPCSRLARRKRAECALGRLHSAPARPGIPQVNGFALPRRGRSFCSLVDSAQDTAA